MGGSPDLANWWASRRPAEVETPDGEFREHLGGDLTVTLLSDIGAALEVHHMDERMVALAVDHLRRRVDR